MEITAALVKELRERTSLGMMECKKALKETDGDIEAAIEFLRKKGQLKAVKAEGRITAEGIISVAISDDQSTGVMLEINSQTDFVAKEENFLSFAKNVTKLALDNKIDSVEALSHLDSGNGETVEVVRQGLVMKIGENIQLRRIATMQHEGAKVGFYIHGARIGVLVALTGGDEELAKDIAMHIAASNPMALDESEVPAEKLEKEKEILMEQVKDSGKPAEIVEKMVQGRLRKFFEEVTLVNQPFVKDPDQKISALLKAKGATINAYQRFEVGEGIEKKEENFADEVQAQVEAAKAKQ